MTPRLSSHRRAEELDRALAGEASPGTAERYADLLAVVGAVRSLEPVSPRPEVSARLRERLMERAVTDLVPLRRPGARLGGPRLGIDRARSPRRERLAGAVASVIVLVGGSAGTAAASQASMPGEPLYPVKRVLEDVRLRLDRTDADRGRHLLGQASTRLDEARALATGQEDPARVGRALDEFGTAALAGTDLLLTAADDQAPAEVGTFAARSLRDLSLLRGELPTTSRSALADSVQLLLDLDRRARAACPGCSDAPALTAPTSLVSLDAPRALARLVAAPNRQAGVDAVEAALAGAAAIGDDGPGATGGSPTALDPATVLGELGGTTPAPTPTPGTTPGPSSPGPPPTPRDLARDLAAVSRPVTRPVTGLLETLTQDEGKAAAGLTGSTGGSVTAPVEQKVEGVAGVVPDPTTGLTP